MVVVFWGFFYNICLIILLKTKWWLLLAEQSHACHFAGQGWKLVLFFKDLILKILCFFFYRIWHTEKTIQFSSMPFVCQSCLSLQFDSFVFFCQILTQISSSVHCCWSTKQWLDTFAMNVHRGSRYILACAFPAIGFACHAIASNRKYNWTPPCCFTELAVAFEMDDTDLWLEGHKGRVRLVQVSTTISVMQQVFLGLWKLSVVFRNVILMLTDETL